MLKVILLHIIFIMGALSCNNSKQTKKDMDQPRSYFDINNYLDHYLADMDTARYVQKTITLNNKEERKLIKKYLVERDLSAFRSRDISRPKYNGKFDIYTEKIDTRFVRTDYKSNDPKLKIKTFSVIKDHDDQIQSIQIVEMKRTTLVNQNNMLFFSPRQGYRIVQCDSLQVLGRKCKTVEVLYVKDKKKK